MYKTIGILGGMGPGATVDLMKKIIDATEAESDQQHIPVLVDSNTRIPDRTAALLHDGEDPVPEMVLSAKRLESMGADFIIMPCNTAHCFIDAVRKEVSIPVLDMPKETASLLQKKGVRRAAVLATDGTVQTGLYERDLREHGIETIYPEEEQQRQIMSLIYDCMKKGVRDAALLPVSEMTALCGDLKAKGAGALLLACTELPMAFELMGIEDDALVDPTAVLAEAAVRYAGAPVKK